jgi:hypothetical protein
MPPRASATVARASRAAVASAAVVNGRMGGAASGIVAINGWPGDRRPSLHDLASGLCTAGGWFVTRRIGCGLRRIAHVEENPSSA